MELPAMFCLGARQLTAIPTIVLLSACGSVGSEQETLSRDQEATRCGTTYDWQDIEFYDGSDPVFSDTFVSRYEQAFGMSCSGTMISKDLFLSVHHCFPGVGEFVGFNCQLDGNDPYPPMTTQAEIDAANAAALARCVYYEVTEVVHSSTDPDISVTRLDGNPGAEYGWVIPSVRLPKIDERVAIFQHPQRHAGPKRRKVVAFGPTVSNDSVSTYYSVDTYGGSSGSGVLDVTGHLIAVHRASGCTDTGGSNTGTHMPYIFDNVRAVRDAVVPIWAATM